MPVDAAGARLSPLLKRIFENRNLTDPAELTYPLARMLPPDTLKNADRASALLFAALTSQQRILIIGDYDTDGATATALGLICLRAMGADNIDYLVPNRFEFGYGLSPEIAEVAVQKNPNLVITVDNGINSVPGVSVLKQRNISVIITDHHLAGPILPDADAILNPNQPGCGFPSKALAGVGVMFYLLLLLRAKLKAANWFADMHLTAPNLAEYLDLVALGTVADMVPLDYNNRILVAQGVARIKAGRCRPGILALMEVSARDYRNMVASDLGFVIAPRLNAAGRLDDISIGIECLLTDDRDTARDYAETLNDINLERRVLEQKMQSQAMKIVRGIVNSAKQNKAKKNKAKQNKNDRATNLSGFCLYEPDWHQGIVGLVASRVKDKTNQPVIAFADTVDDKLTGSARSVAGLHIKDLLENISAAHAGLIVKFGGHAMAAGLTIAEKNFVAFKAAFHNHVAAHFANADATGAIYTDGDLPENEITLDNAEQLRAAAPWGQGFPAPLFDGVFIVTAQKVVGEHHLRFTLQPADGTCRFEGIAFRAIEPGQPRPQLDRIHAVYQLDVNEFRGRRSLQLIIEHFQPTSE
ncbi:single-stranded-DNA-specific exonuclease RecJ [Candidatus Spongiihabitans sp.]|uniref:single-stranded-DNA-specific exonuclease RecJ n=1 Tax=Candidatus Spongiihabitans sp. TaxID=3101308 RepID=UPI003C7DEE73